MASERTIPHLRDVFGLSGYASSSHHRQTASTNDYYTNRGPPTTTDIGDYRYQPQQQQQQQSHYNNYTHQQQQQPANPAHQQFPQQQQQQQQHTIQPNEPMVAAQRQPTRSSKTRRGDNYKTLTPGDVKTLERHLSMKKTIRKKIMRDLQQAFVDDPNEFATGVDQRQRAELNMEAALRFGGAAADAHNLQQSDNFLVMLRDDDQTNGGRGGLNGGANYGQQQQQQRMTPASREYDYDAGVGAASAAQTATTKEEKPSFWKRLTMKNKTSKR